MIVLQCLIFLIKFLSFSFTFTNLIELQVASQVFLAAFCFLVIISPLKLFYLSISLETKASWTHFFQPIAFTYMMKMHLILHSFNNFSNLLQNEMESTILNAGQSVIVNHDESLLAFLINIPNFLNLAVIVGLNNEQEVLMGVWSYCS